MVTMQDRRGRGDVVCMDSLLCLPDMQRKATQIYTSAVLFLSVDF